MIEYTDLAASLYLLHKTCWVDSTLGSPDWTVGLNAYAVQSSQTCKLRTRVEE